MKTDTLHKEAGEHKMKTEFLFKEYDECFSQLRFYDERQNSLLKYTVTISSTVATVLTGLITTAKITPAQLLVVGATTAFVVFIGLCVLFLCMVQNRLYFTYVARQINAIRSFMLKKECPEFTDNQMYTSTTFPAFKWRSTQTLMMAGVALISSVYFSSFIYCYLSFIKSPHPLRIAVVIGVVCLIVKSLIAGKYLQIQGTKKADQAIHRE